MGSIVHESFTFGAACTCTSATSSLAYCELKCPQLNCNRLINFIFEQHLKTSTTTARAGTKLPPKEPVYIPPCRDVTKPTGPRRTFSSNDFSLKEEWEENERNAKEN